MIDPKLEAFLEGVRQEMAEPPMPRYDDAGPCDGDKVVNMASRRTLAAARKILASDMIRPAMLTTRPTTKEYSRNWYLQVSELRGLAKAVVDNDSQSAQVRKALHGDLPSVLGPPPGYDDLGFDPRDGGKVARQHVPKVFGHRKTRI